MIVVSYEIPCDLEIAYPSLHHISIGDTDDPCIGFSEVGVAGDIVGFSNNNNECFRITDWSIIDTDGLCRVNGTLTNPWGRSKAIKRIDLYSDNLSANTSIYTNSRGQFFFLGLPGERLKIRLPDESMYWWISVPDKSKLTWEQAKTYGY